MRYYPIFIDVSDKHMLVAGAGAVGRRKVASLLAAGPRSIAVIDPALNEKDLPPLLRHERITCHARAFEPTDLADKSLVFAATGKRDVNAFIADLCRGQGLFCNVIDAPLSGSFIVPAHFYQNGLTVALCTEGQSPALAKKLREELEAWVGKRYIPLLTVLGRLRPLLLELALPTEQNSTVFRSLIQSPLADLLANKQHAEAAARLAQHLPEQLHARMGELLHGI